MEVGMGLYHKYRGVAVAKIQASSGMYLCPLSSLVPNPSMKCLGSAEIASRTGEHPCAVTLYWHEYGGYTVVSGGGLAMGQQVHRLTPAALQAMMPQRQLNILRFVQLYYTVGQNKECR
jgi:hypothetical protein